MALVRDCLLNLQNEKACYIRSFKNTKNISQLWKERQQDSYDLLDFTNYLFITVSANNDLIYFCKIGYSWQISSKVSLPHVPTCEEYSVFSNSRKCLDRCNVSWPCTEPNKHTKLSIMVKIFFLNCRWLFSLAGISKSCLPFGSVIVFQDQ